MITWDVNPVAIGPVAALGGLEVRWYSLFFALGVVLYYLTTRWLWKRRGFVVSEFETLVVFLFVGLVVGARLGEIFFYQWDYYSSNWVEIFKVWKGGLSSHGATVGLVAAYACFWLWKKFKREDFSFSKYVDAAAVCMPLVAGFVRLGNFFNSEIVGRATDSVFGVVFALNGESFARHPVQLYEGLLAWAVFAIVFVLYLKGARKGIFAKSGFFLFLFVFLYFTGRFFIEFFKEYQILVGSDRLPWGMTMGQALSIVPVVVAVGWAAYRLHPFKWRDP